MFDAVIVQADSFQTANGTARNAPQWLTGFEYGTLSIAGTAIVDTIVGDATVVSTNSPRTGSYHLQLIPTGAAAANITKGIFSSNKKSVRFYIKVPTRPASGVGMLFGMTGATAVPTLQITSTGVLQYASNNAAFSSSATLTTTNWHLVEMQIDTSTATYKMDIKVDGVAYTQHSGASTLGSLNSVRFGTTSTTGPAYTAYIDDIIVGPFTGAIPSTTEWWGAGAVYGLGAHTSRAALLTGATTTFRSYDANNNTDVNKYSILWYGKVLNELPMTNILTRVEQATTSASIGVSPYIDIPLAQLTQSTRKINGVRAITAQHVFAAGINTIPLAVIRQDGTAVDIWSTNIAGSTTIIYRGGTVIAPTSGWNSAGVNDLYYRIGGSNDIAPTGGNDAVMIEVDVPQEPPVVVLNTANAFAFGTDTTPTVEFTGTDRNSDDVRYNVQIDTTSGFSPADSYSETNQSSSTQIGGTGDDVTFQSFTGNGGTLTEVKFWLSSTGTPTTNLTAYIYAHAGTYGTSSVPTGTALATSVVVSSVGINATYRLVTFTFSGANKIALANGTRYTAVIQMIASGDINDVITPGVDNTSPAHAGNTGFASQIAGPWTATNTTDLCFYVYAPKLDKLSGTDPGFLNTINGADTDPFTSGQMASFTVQAGDALASGTYYWRARGLDPLGSNTYGAFSGTRTFTVSTGGATGQVKYWNGTAFVAKPVKVWNGSAWAVKPLKRWNGTSWITTPY